MGMLEAVKAARERTRRREVAPVNYIDWLPLQHEFLSDNSKRLQMRAGNQTMGKTWAGLANGIWHALGEHPFYEVPPPPREGAVVCASWAQSLKVQKKLWNLLPKDQISPETIFREGVGFVGRYPCVKWRNGSVTWIVTAKQDALDLSAATYDWIHFDEPPARPRIYAELIKRLTRGNPGRAWLTYTPINAPVDYLKALVDQGIVVDHWSRLNAASLIPVGHTAPMRLEDGTICNQEWIDALILDTFDHEVPVLIHGEWENRSTGAIFKAFRLAGARSHVVQSLSDLDLSTRVAIDYGSGAQFSAAASLLQAKVGGLHPKIWVCDESVSGAGKESTTMGDDAAAIIAMLTRNGLHWTDLDIAYGDRPWDGKKGLIRKDNSRMMAALERAYEMSPGTLHPRLKTVKTGKNRGGRKSITFGVRFLHRCMVRDGHFNIHGDCERGILAVQRWDWTPKTEKHKHILDTWRYGFDDLIFADADKPRIAPVHVR